MIAPQENARDLAKLPPTVNREMEIIFAASMDQVIAAAICLDDVQVDGLLDGIEPAVSIPVPDAVAAVTAAAVKVNLTDDGSANEAS